MDVQWLAGVTAKGHLYRRLHAFVDGNRRAVCKARFADEVTFVAAGLPRCASCARRLAGPGMLG